MSSVLSSTTQGVFLATAMVVSSTVLYLAFNSKHKSQENSSDQNLRSCLSSEGKRREKKKKKRVQFAENVKDTKGNGEEYRREKENSLLAKQIRGETRINNNNPDEKKSRRRSDQRNCRNEIPEIHKMPANRIALYNGILRDRVHRTGCSH